MATRATSPSRPEESGAALLDLDRNTNALAAAEEACRLGPHESGNHALCSTALRQVKRYGLPPLAFLQRVRGIAVPAEPELVEDVLGVQ
jgi:hypothetical protein